MTVQDEEKAKGTDTHSLVKVGTDDDALQTYMELGMCCTTTLNN